MKKIKGLLVLASIAFITACGSDDSGGSSNNGGSVTNPSIPPPIVNTPESGSVNDPINIKNGKTYQLNSNYFYNNFKFSAKSGDKAFIKYSVELPEYQQTIWDCRKFSSNTHLTVATESGDWSSRTCSDKMKIDVNETQNFNVEVKSAGPGVLNITSFNVKSILKNPIGDIGTPGNPKPLNFNNNNQLSSNPFYNYYKFQAKKDQTFVFKGTFDYPITDSLVRLFKNRYNSGEHRDNRYFNTVYNSNYERVRTGTEKDFEFKIPEDGIYYIEAGYYYPYTGFFNAALVD